MEKIKLYNNTKIPLIGYGVFQITDKSQCEESVLNAIKTGYRMIEAMAWAPFAEGKNKIFSNKVLAEIGAQYGKTPAQVILRWLRQKNIIAIPKSVHLDRIIENYNTNNFKLSESDIQRIDVMDTGNPLILEIHCLDEAYRLHNIKFIQ